MNTIRSSAVVGSVIAADAMMSGGDGQPETLAGVTVTLDGEHAMGETMETGMDGGFAFTGLRAGTYTVTISDFPEDVSFETVSIEVPVDVGEVGNADFTGHFIRTSAVEGQVVIEGEGLAGVTVTLSGGPADESYTAMTDADGMYRFEDLRPGDYTVSISDFDVRDYEFAATSQDVSVDLDETGTVSFTGVLLRTSGISGRVSVAGMGLDGIAVTLSGAADDSTMTADGGQYSFAGLAAGDYTVTIAVESDAYVFDSMSEDRTVGDDDSQIVNFEGAHATTASISAMLFIDEGAAGRNDMHDEGETAFPSAAMLEALQAGGVALPPLLPVPVTLVGPEVNQMTSGALNVATGQVVFSGLRAGSYHLQVGSLGALLAGLPPQVAAVLQDYEYGGPSEGYAIDVDVGEMATQGVPVDITHTTVHFGVTLKSGDTRGMPVPGATVTLSTGHSGMTGEAGEPAMIRFARAGTSDNMVSAGVEVEGLHVAEGMSPVVWDPTSPYTQGANANDILNLNVAVSISGATVETEYGGGTALAGWAINVMSGEDAVEGAPEDLDDEGNASFEAAVEADDLPVSYSFSVAAEQNDSLDGGETISADTVDYAHTGLTLGGEEVALEVSYATQTIMVYVHHERDQVEGYTGGVLGGDRRTSESVDVGIRYVSGSRSHAFTKEMWDAGKNTDEEKGVWTFTGVPADKDVLVVASVAADANVVIHGSDQLATFEDFEDNGVTGSAFGALGGFHHTVELCPLQASAPAGQDFDECASFAFVNTYAVSGWVWKNGVERDDDDGFDLSLIDDEEPVAVEDIEVSMTAVEGKNLAGEDESHNSTNEDGDATIPFDFGDMADGVYALSVPDGWMATAVEEPGGDGDKLPKEFLLEDKVDGDGALNIDVTPATGVLYGRITDDGTDQPAKGVTVTVNGTASDVTDEFGRYIVEGFDKRKPPAKKAIVVSLSGAGYVAATDSITKFTANMPMENDLKIESLGEVATVSGTVTRSNGDPVAGVSILVNGKAPLNATGKPKALKTGDDGSYSALVNAGDVIVKPSAPKMAVSFIPASHAFSIIVGQEFDGIDFVAYDHATITGRVLDPDGGPVQHVKVTATAAGAAADADPTASYTTRSTGAFSLSVPFGAYTIAGDGQDGSYTFKYPSDNQTVNVAPGQRVAFGDIEATLSASGRPPRFTSSNKFSVAEGKRVIGTVEAVDDDSDDEITGYIVAGGDDADKIGITSAGVLEWAGTLPSHDDEVAANNKYKVTVTATSAPKATATGTTTQKTANQKIEVTLTASGDAVVTMVVTPDKISESGGVSMVSAEIDRALEAPFTVEVNVTASAHYKVSGSSLFFAAGAKASVGSVSITAVNNNSHNADRKVTVDGTTTTDGITIESTKLTIEDDDVGPGQVVLKLAGDPPHQIDESDNTAADAPAGVTENEITLTAEVVGGTPFSQDVTITVGIAGDDDASTAAAGDAVNLSGLTLTIPSGERSSSEASTAAEQSITITAQNDADATNEAVVVTGTATLPDGSDAGTEPDPVPAASAPDDVVLAVIDDDENPTAPRNLATVADGTTASTYNATWDPPANLGKTDRAANAATALTYRYRFERSEVRITDAPWANGTTDGTTGDGSATINLLTLFPTGTTTASEVWQGRSYTVQVEIYVAGTGGEADASVEGTRVTREFTVPPPSS